MSLMLGGFELHLGSDGKLEQLLSAGRNLLFDQPQEVDLGGGRLFRPAGWDECFPTIDPHGESPVMGELVGRTSRVTRRAGSISQTWRTPRFQARRRFTFDNAGRLVLAFSARNDSEFPQDFLWASHALFPLARLRRATLPDGRVLSDFALDGREAKWFVANAGPVVLFRPEGQVILTTDQPWWGIWLNCGGWPPENRAAWGCIGIEATNTPGETPGGAVLQAGAAFQGQVTLEFRS